MCGCGCGCGKGLMIWMKGRLSRWVRTTTKKKSKNPKSILERCLTAFARSLHIFPIDPPLRKRILFRQSNPPLYTSTLPYRPPLPSMPTPPSSCQITLTNPTSTNFSTSRFIFATLLPVLLLSHRNAARAIFRPAPRTLPQPRTSRMRICSLPTMCTT